MRILLALILGVVLGAAALWFYGNYRTDPRLQSAGQKVENVARSAHDAATNQLQAFHLRPEDIKDELARTGRVVRRTASDAGHAIADATADTRITAAIKTKLIGNRDLSAINISVNTTAGVVTLSGAVDSSEDIGKAILLAMQTDGVREVLSTLQVIPKNK